VLVPPPPGEFRYVAKIQFKVLKIIAIKTEDYYKIIAFRIKITKARIYNNVLYTYKIAIWLIIRQKCACL
jgi:hypothetical protein